MASRRPRLTRLCAVTPGERIFRAFAAVFVGAFALSSLDNLWCAIPAGVCSGFLAFGAITGWCPTSLLPREAEATEPNTLGIPESRQHIDV